MASIQNRCAGQFFPVPGRNALYHEMVRGGYLSPKVAPWSDSVPAKCGETASETWMLNVFDFEGGPVNHPADKGGPTNKGVTIATWQSLAPALFKIEGTVTTLWKITDGQVIRIADYYWKQAGAHLIHYEAIQILAAELNWGTAFKSKPIQEAVNATSPAKLKVDGVIGPITAQAINDHPDVEALYEAIGKRIEVYYRNIVRNDGTQSVFLAGWLRRVYETRAYARFFYPLKKKRVA